MIDIINTTKETIEEQNLLVELMDYALNYLKINDVTFNIILVDNKKIHELNREYRNIDRETDVITFALEDSKEEFITPFRILGDIYISIDKAKEQAKEYNHSFKREICFLAVHGLLHLLGYDHMNEEDEKVMFSYQELILNEFGIKREN